MGFRADPFVEVGLSEKGEHLLGAAGEVHLETVVKDLRERFARVDFQVNKWEQVYLGGLFLAGKLMSRDAGCRVVKGLFCSVGTHWLTVAGQTYAMPACCVAPHCA